MTKRQARAPTKAGDRNHLLWLLVPAWALAVTVSVYATLRLSTSVFTVADVGWAVLQCAMIVTGVIILANRPGNAVGRFIIASGLVFAAGWLLFIPSVLYLENGQVYRAGLAEATSNAAASLRMPLLLAAFIYFPDGTFSPRLRWVRPVLWVTGFLAVLAPLANGGWGGDETTAITENSLRDALHPLGEITAAAFGLALIVTTFTACVLVIIRSDAPRGSSANR